MNLEGTARSNLLVFPQEQKRNMLMLRHKEKSQVKEKYLFGGP